MATVQPTEVGKKRKLDDGTVESSNAVPSSETELSASEKPPKKKVVVVKKIVRKIRKARQQVPKRSADEELQKEEVTGDYNIWYHKYNGQRFSFKDRTYVPILNQFESDMM